MRSITTKKLTISIVTADRECIDKCLTRLSKLTCIDEVVVRVLDNSVSDERSLSTSNLCKSFGFDYVRVRGFMESRNLSVTLCQTKFMTILDDDDFYTDNALIVMLSDINRYSDSNVDMICYGVEKVGRVSKFDNKYTEIDGIMKLSYLNKFDNYNYDRLTKVYLWNAGIIFRLSLLKQYCTWLYPGCDDIYPVTNAYLNARKVIKANVLIYYYPQQTTIESKKSDSELSTLDDYMYRSYSKLLGELDFDDKDESLLRLNIIKRCISNSVQQMRVLDLYEPKKLLSLCTF